MGCWCYVALNSSRRQYMHSSGMSMVRVISTGFLWVDNHLNDSQSLHETSTKLFRKLREVQQVCGSHVEQS